MPLDPRGDSCERRASLDDFFDKKCLGVIRRGPQSETVETHEDGHGRERHALVAVDEGVVVGETLEKCARLLAEGMRLCLDMSRLVKVCRIRRAGINPPNAARLG